MPNVFLTFLGVLAVVLVIGVGASALFGILKELNRANELKERELKILAGCKAIDKAKDEALDH